MQRVQGEKEKLEVSARLFQNSPLHSPNSFVYFNDMQPGVQICMDLKAQSTEFY